MQSAGCGKIKGRWGDGSVNHCKRLDRVAAVLNERLLAHVAPDGLLLARVLLDGIAAVGVAGRGPLRRVPSRDGVVLPKSLELLETKTVTLFDEEVDEPSCDKVAYRACKKVSKERKQIVRGKAAHPAKTNPRL